MLIGFTGPQSTGKSTLLSRMSLDLHFNKCTFIKEVTRKVARRGCAINDSGDNVTQLFILNEHLNNHFTSGCMVLDRCIVDGLVYTEYLHDTGKVDSWVVEYARELYTMLLKRLDIILYPDPEDVPLVDDGVRSVNSDFRESIIERYDKLFASDVLFASKCVVLSGDVDSRIKTIKHNLRF